MLIFYEFFMNTFLADSERLRVRMGADLAPVRKKVPKFWIVFKMPENLVFKPFLWYNVIREKDKKRK